MGGKRCPKWFPWPMKGRKSYMTEWNYLYMVASLRVPPPKRWTPRRSRRKWKWKPRVVRKCLWSCSRIIWYTSIRWEWLLILREASLASRAANKARTIPKKLPITPRKMTRKKVTAPRVNRQNLHYRYRLRSCTIEEGARNLRRIFRNWKNQNCWRLSNKRTTKKNWSHCKRLWP